MGFDIRVPIGFLFTTLGALLVLFGLITFNSPIYSQSLGMNINLGWGIVLLIFGLLMVFFARRAKGREAPQPASSANRGGH
jgi:membrane protein implicated in regulation of membrane protease activity